MSGFTPLQFLFLIYQPQPTVFPKQGLLTGLICNPPNGAQLSQMGPDYSLKGLLFPQMGVITLFL